MNGDNLLVDESIFVAHDEVVGREQLLALLQPFLRAVKVVAHLSRPNSVHKDQARGRRRRGWVEVEPRTGERDERQASERRANGRWRVKVQKECMHTGCRVGI